MAQIIRIHPTHPQLRLLRQTTEILQRGGVVAYPTDSAYALGCIIGNSKGIDRIRKLRQLDEKHNFSLVCRDLSELANYALVNNSQYRFLKGRTPGPYTFILKGSREVPRRLMHPKRRTVGLRIPDNPITQALLQELGSPLMSTTLTLPDHALPLTDPEEIFDRLGRQIDLVVDGGYGGIEPTAVVSLLDEEPELIRERTGITL